MNKLDPKGQHEAEMNLESNNETKLSLLHALVILSKSSLQIYSTCDKSCRKYSKPFMMYPHVKSLERLMQIKK